RRRQKKTQGARQGQNDCQKECRQETCRKGDRETEFEERRAGKCIVNQAQGRRHDCRPTYIKNSGTTRTQTRNQKHSQEHDQKAMTLGEASAGFLAFIRDNKTSSSQPELRAHERAVLLITKYFSPNKPLAEITL